MKTKLTKVLGVLCTSCYAILGFLDMGDVVSIFFFGEPEYPVKPDDSSDN